MTCALGAVRLTDTLPAEISFDSAPACTGGATVTCALGSLANGATVTAQHADPGSGRDPTYTLTVANRGLSDAQAVTLSDSLPAGTTFVSATGDPAKPCSAVATTVTCDVGVLAAGASQTMLVTVRLSASLPPQTLTNTATASSPTSDPVSGNNTATAAVQTVVIADLSVTKTLETPSPLVAGHP